jgi:hypothetical protein
VNNRRFLLTEPPSGQDFLTLVDGRLATVLTFGSISPLYEIALPLVVMCVSLGRTRQAPRGSRRASSLHPLLPRSLLEDAHARRAPPRSGILAQNGGKGQRTFGSIPAGGPKVTQDAKRGVRVERLVNRTETGGIRSASRPERSTVRPT